MESVEDRVSFVKSLGIVESKAKEIAGKAAQFESLRGVAREAGVEGGCDKSIGTLLQELALQWPKAGSLDSRAVVARCVASRDLDSSERLQAAMRLAEECGPQAVVTRDALSARCLFGRHYSDAELASAAAAAADEAPQPLLWTHLGALLQATRKKLPFVDGAKAKTAVETLLTQRLGPKADDKKKDAKADKPKTEQPQQQQQGKKKKDEKAEDKRFVAPAINTQASDSRLAQQLVELVRSAPAAGINDEHLVALVADTLAAVRRASYGKGAASAGIVAGNGVVLPIHRAKPE